MRLRSTTALLFAALAAAGCASNGAGGPFGGGPDGERTVRIEVRNLNFADATLHALRGSERVRLGIVTGKTDRTFDVEWTVALPLQVEINLLAGGRCTTREMNVDPGDIVELQIQSVLRTTDDCV
jgi:hypothetical protein